MEIEVNVLFICTGNTCRSPMAEAMLMNMVPDYQVKSAGIFANEASTTNGNTVKVLNEHHIKIDHQVQQVTHDLIQWADIVLTMTLNHKQVLVRQYEQHKNKMYTLIEYVGNHKDEQYLDINDPYGGEISDYQRVFNELHTYITAFVEKANHNEGDES